MGRAPGAVTGVDSIIDGMGRAWRCQADSLAWPETAPGTQGWPLNGKFCMSPQAAECCSAGREPRESSRLHCPSAFSEHPFTHPCSQGEGAERRGSVRTLAVRARVRNGSARTVAVASARLC